MRPQRILGIANVLRLAEAKAKVSILCEEYEGRRVVMRGQPKTEAPKLSAS
jgi:hypothetical protein